MNEDALPKARAYSSWLRMLCEIMSRATTPEEIAFAADQQRLFFVLQAEKLADLLMVLAPEDISEATL